MRTKFQVPCSSSSLFGVGNQLQMEKSILSPARCTHYKTPRSLRDAFGSCSFPYVTLSFAFFAPLRGAQAFPLARSLSLAQDAKIAKKSQFSFLLSVVLALSSCCSLPLPVPARQTGLCERHPVLYCSSSYPLETARNPCSRLKA